MRAALAQLDQALAALRPGVLPIPAAVFRSIHLTRELLAALVLETEVLREEVARLQETSHGQT